MKNKIEVIASKRGYVVTEDGILLNPNGKEIGIINSAGYKITMIRVKGKQIIFTAHRLQAYQKYGNKLFEDNIITRHLDGHSLNNSWNNIAIGTQSDNMMDIPEQIRIKKAKYAASFNRKYNKEEIKKFHRKEKSYKKTMEKFNSSSKGTLNYILNT